MSRLGVGLLVATMLAGAAGAAPQHAAKAKPHGTHGKTPPAAKTTEPPLLPPPAPAAAATVDAGATAAPTQADAPTVSARADRVQARIGDAITVLITAIHRKGVIVNLPTRLETGAFQLQGKAEDESPTDIGDGKYRQEFRLYVAAYETGDLQFPALDVTYITPGGEVRTIQTTPLDVRVESMLDGVAAPELKENAGPVRVLEKIVWPFYAGGTVFAILMLALIWAYAKRLYTERVERAAPPLPPRPAHELALERLNHLRGRGHLERAEWKPFYFTVSEIIRDYLGGRYGFDALELTTTELLGALKEVISAAILTPAPTAAGPAPTAARPYPDEGAYHLIESWCGNCDLVKFAGILPTPDEAQAVLEDAFRIVDMTRPREASVTLPREEAQVGAA
jgi:hypothetical protein